MTMMNPNAPAGPPSAGPPGTPMGMSPDMIEAFKRKIEQMPPGPQKDAMLARLSRDYQGEADLAGKVYERNRDLADMAAPGVTQTGGRFGTTVAASPIEHVTTAIRRGQGMRGENQAMEDLKSLSKDKQQAVIDLLRSGMGGGTQYGMQNRLP